MVSQQTQFLFSIEYNNKLKGDSTDRNYSKGFFMKTNWYFQSSVSDPADIFSICDKIYTLKFLYVFFKVAP